MSKKDSALFSNLKSDLPASIIVFLVALPLCLGISLASGAPLFSGLIAGIVGGIVVAAFSGSALGVSGPAAGLAVIVLGAIQDLGSFNTFLLAVVIAGVVQIILGFLRAGVIGYYFPSSVIKGMLSGIGIIIILKQIPHAVGYDRDPEGDFAFRQVDGHNTLNELLYMFEDMNMGAIIIALLSMLILILWEQPFIKKYSFSKIIQAPLITVILGIVLGISFSGDATLGLKAKQLVQIPVADSLMGFFDQFTFPDLSQWNNSQVYVLGITMAIVASLETLLCLEATDKLDPHKRVTPTNRELTAQGIGNIVSGFIGGLPITQVIVRSSANIQSGGKTKLSAILHGVLLLVSAMAIPKLLNLIPLASLAAILFIVGYKLAKPSIFKEMIAAGREQYIPFFITVIGIVFTDLLTGIGIGLAVAIVFILWKNYSLPFHFEKENYEAGKPVTIELSEVVSFLNKANILRVLKHLPEGTHLIMDASKTKSIHPDVLEIIEDFISTKEERNITVELKGLKRENLDGGVTDFGHLVLNQNKR